MEYTSISSSQSSQDSSVPAAYNQPMKACLKLTDENLSPAFNMTIPAELRKFFPRAHTECSFVVAGGHRAYQLDYEVVDGNARFKKEQWEEFVTGNSVKTNDSLEMEFVGGLKNDPVFEVKVTIVHTVASSDEDEYDSGEGTDCVDEDEDEE